MEILVFGVLAVLFIGVVGASQRASARRAARRRTPDPVKFGPSTRAPRGRIKED